MPFFLSRLLMRLTALTSWLTPVFVIVFVFCTSWPLMTLAEPPGSALVEPKNYWWYFVVTSATVGYGDHYPQTTAGHLVGVYVIVGGIGALTTVFTKLSSLLEQARRRHMRGSIVVETLSDHIVLLGYTPGRTERIVSELVTDDGEGELVLCAWDDVVTHPMPGAVAFVRGDLTTPSTLHRAAVHRARAVLVDVRDDNEALAVALAVHNTNDDVHLVVSLRDMNRSTLLGFVGDHVRPVQWHTPRMITEELESPGISEVFAGLLSHGGVNTHAITLPESVGTVSVRRCHAALGHEHNATLIAVRTESGLVVNPPWDDDVPPGTVLYYLGERPLTQRQIATTLRS